MRREVWVSVLAIDASSSDDWTRAESPLLVELRKLARQMHDSGLSPDLVLWQQGEADARNHVSTNLYAENLERLAAELTVMGISAPVLIARSTVCRTEPSAAIRAAIEAAVAADRRLILGPDTDSLFRTSDRIDGCHFSRSGLDSAAGQWADAIMGVESVTNR
jgi:hypothetical protein